MSTAKNLWRGRLATAPTATLAVVAVIALALGGCSKGKVEPAVSPTKAADGAASPIETADGATYSTTAFAVPFDVTVPNWLPASVTSDTANFVTWDPPRVDDPAVRFLLPVNVYQPGQPEAISPPKDYLAFLLAQSEQGATFTDQSETAVDGKPATLLTATAQHSLDGSLGCPNEGLKVDECFGLQPELALRIAVVDLNDRTLLVWLRHSGTGDSSDATDEFNNFEDMLRTVRFSGKTPSTTPDATAEATPLDGVWTTSITENELKKSPLLMDAGEVNDDNYGDFAFTFGNGKFELKQTTPPQGSISGTLVVEAKVVTLNLDSGDHFVMRYSIKHDDLTFERDESLGVAPTPFVVKPWHRKATP